MKKYKLINNTLGWIVFAIAAVTYLLTLEPTASFWDCPEFVAQGFKSEIGHPPGNPIFILAARFAANFAGGDISKVAVCVNAMSAIFSALTILLLFWTITHLVKKLLVTDGEEDRMTLAQYLVIMGSGIAGALAYTWSDTFWFSAVEAEVYAFSSFCTALVFWLILKWEDQADEPGSDRWLILIAYVFGVSLGVHLLNLLCIPAIALVFYYRKFKNTTARGSLITLLISFAVIVFILYGLEPGFVEWGQYFDLFCVNTLGMSYNTGVLIYAILLVAVLAWGLYELYSGRSANRIKLSFLLGILLSGGLFFGESLLIPAILLIALAVYLFKFCNHIPVRIFSNILLSIMVIFIGFASYALILIRSGALTPLDENSPSNTFALAKYLSREQYGETPLLYGRTLFSEIVYKESANGTFKPDYKEGRSLYAQKVKENPTDKDEYVEVGRKMNYRYAPEQNMVFPRIHSEAHTREYQEWLGMEGTEVEATVQVDADGNPIHKESKIKPTMMENLRFFVDYQLNYMYWRYFMWNFAGRQNDIQGMGEVTQGNWISGIPFIDNPRLGDQSLLPDDLGRGNKGHNVFYLLPLLLGVVGLLWQAYRGKRGIEQFWVVFFLFFMTGIAIVMYLNQTPSQPRERDYAYAGSFYAYAIWIGFGVAGLWRTVLWLMTKKDRKSGEREELQHTTKGLAVAAVAALVGLAVPLQMVSQTWDDHDRSGRYAARDFGMNYLSSLDPNAVIFTNGDNDTFPLWYNQDVEGIRTDARVCNLSYLQTDWYIDQMKRPAYDSPSLPITWPRLDFCSGTNEYVEVVPELKERVLEAYKENPEDAKRELGDEPFELKNILKNWVRSKDADRHVIPTDTVFVTIDKEAVRKSGMLMATDSIPDKMVISLAGKRALYKGDLMMLELISQANWVRPIYVATTVGQDNYMNLGENFVQEGLANRITPFSTYHTDQEGNLIPNSGVKQLDTEKTFNNVMNRYKYGGLSAQGLYLDETVMRMCYTHRNLLGTLAMQLIAEDKKDKALQVLQKCEKEIPTYNVPHNYRSGSLDIANAFSMLGKKAEAGKILEELWKNSAQYLKFYFSLNDGRFASSQADYVRHLWVMQRIIQIEEKVDASRAAKMNKELEIYYQWYDAKGGTLPGFQ